MIKTTLLAAAALSFVALGAPTADAKSGHGHGGGGGGHGAHNGGQGKHGGYGKHRGRGGSGKHGGQGRHGHHKYKHHKSNYFWLNYSWFPSRCHYEPQRVRVRVWDRRGHAYFKWVRRDVKVCY